MFYFVPSWYDRERQWYDTTPYWFRVYERMEFDDTINQIKMFHHAKEDSALLILNYQPQLRYFLQKQDLLSENYWSFFDDIQNITQRETTSVDFYDLDWPKGTQFVHTPFAVAARFDKETIAAIHFAENGNLKNIERYDDDHLAYNYIFDDRGFLSSIIYYDKDSKSLYQDYLNPSGVWQVREHLSGTLRLDVNPQADKEFLKDSYRSWEDMISERLEVFKNEMVTPEDVIVIAANTQHNKILSDIFGEQKCVFSLFSNRLDTSDQEAMEAILSTGKLIVTEQTAVQESLEKAQEHREIQVPILKIPPFDTRLRLGHSQNIKELIIYFFVDGLSRGELWSHLKSLLKMMEKNELIQLTLASYQASSNFEALEEEVNDWIKVQLDPLKFFTPKEDTSENKIDDISEMENKRIIYKLFTNETQIIKTLDSARLILDLSPNTDLYTHIAAVSAGIPQINFVTTDYVDDQKNGRVVANQKELFKAIDFYFDGLSNWNQALVYAVQKMAAYTSGKLLKQWKELLEHG